MSYDFVACRTHDGRLIWLWTVIDEYSRERMAIKLARRLRLDNVLARLADPIEERGPPEHIQSNDGLKFRTQDVRGWLANVCVQSLSIEPGSPWENGYNERFKGKQRNELVNGKIFHTLREAQFLIEHWRHDYNSIRPHSALRYRPPAPEAIAPWIVQAGRTFAPGLTYGVES